MWTPCRIMIAPSSSHLQQKSKPHSWLPSSSTFNQSPLLWLTVTPCTSNSLCSSLAWLSVVLTSQVLLILPIPIRLPSCYNTVRAKKQIWPSYPAEHSAVAAHCQKTKPQAPQQDTEHCRHLLAPLIFIPTHSLLTTPHWTACYPTRQVQASLLLFTLFQECASSCLKLSDPANSSSRFKTQASCLISAYGHISTLLLSTLIFPHKTLCILLAPSAPGQWCPLRMSQCDFHLIKA